MDLITRSDLQYRDYSWKAIPGDNPLVIGRPDSSLLNRREGYEMVNFINAFCKKHGLKQKSSAHKVEKLVREVVPVDIHSSIKIVSWIETNWERYS